MRKISRRHKENREKTKDLIFSNLNEAINILKETANTKFVETVEFHINLNINQKYSNQHLRTTVKLPHNINKSISIAVLTNENNFIQAQTAGADIVGNDDLIEQIRQGKISFDLLIATPDMMPKLAKLGRILGPKKLMPSPKVGTITKTLTTTLRDFKKGKFEYKTDKTGSIHVNVGKSNFTKLQLFDNLTVLYRSIEKNCPSNIKGTFFKNLFICTSMGPSIQLHLNAFDV